MKGNKALQRVCEEDTHKSRELSQVKGRLDHRKGNDAADATARRGRPEPKGKNRNTIAALRIRKKQLVEDLHNVGNIGTDMAALKKRMVLQRADKAKKAGVLPHTMTYAFGKWACSS